MGHLLISCATVRDMACLAFVGIPNDNNAASGAVSWSCCTNSSRCGNAGQPINICALSICTRYDRTKCTTSPGNIPMVSGGQYGMLPVFAVCMKATCAGGMRLSEQAQSKHEANERVVQ